MGASGGGALTSRLGRRFVLLFALCALLPLVVFAALAANRVAGHVQADLRATLHSAAKASGMGIAARLRQVAGDLRLTADLVQSAGAGGRHAVGEALQGQVCEHFDAVWSVARGRAEPLVGDGPLPALELGEEERAHLASGAPLVHVAAGGAELLMVLELAPERPGHARVVGRLRGDWFWDPHELRGVQCEFVACDRRGQVLYHTFDELPRTQPLAAAVGRQASSGAFEWAVDGEAHVARYWHAFLRPQYGLDLWVVQSRSQREAFAVGDAFTRWFWLTAACTLLCVVLGSLVQMRRTLGPIVSLREATRRLGRGELDVRVRLESRDELGDLGRAFDDMAGRLQENIARREQTEQELVASRDAALAAVRAKAEFVTNVSHEFRTPMAEILGATEILTQLEGEQDLDAREEFSGIALHGAQRLARLLDDVLELSESAPRQHASVDLEASVRAAVDRGPDALRERVAIERVGELPAVFGDAGRLEETWTRLLDNACKFSPDDAPVVVRLRRDGDDALVEVVDRGAGIAAADQERVFEPFAQCGRDQLVDKAQGAGLGLTLAKAAVEAHGGAIRVVSELGRGATFEVRLPVGAVARS